MKRKATSRSKRRTKRQDTEEEESVMAETLTDIQAESEEGRKIESIAPESEKAAASKASKGKTILDEVMKANEAYNPMPGAHLLGPQPQRHFAIITCMDARLDVFRMMGLKEGDAHIIRNGGGRIDQDTISCWARRSS